jgi:hypothetical protein
MENGGRCTHDAMAGGRGRIFGSKLVGVDLKFLAARYPSGADSGFMF